MVDNYYALAAADSKKTRVTFHTPQKLPQKFAKYNPNRSNSHNATANVSKNPFYNTTEKGEFDSPNFKDTAKPNNDGPTQHADYQGNMHQAFQEV